MADKTVTVRPSGGTYTTLAAAITGEVAANANLVTMDGILTISIEGTWSSADTSAVNVDGFTVDSAHYVRIVTDSANRAGTVWSTSKYRLSARIDLSDNYIRITGLQVLSSGNAGIWVSNEYCSIDSVFIKDSQYGIVCNSTNTLVRNSIFLNNADYGAYVNYATFQNCCFVGTNSGPGVFSDYGNNTFINCYSGDNSGADYLAGDGTTVLTTSFSEDGTLSSPTAIFSASTFTSITAGSEDFSLVSGSDLIGAGTDLSADATYPFDWDITGATRTTWDVGAAWFDAGGGGIVCAGITSTASIGTPAISATISASGITSTEAIGSPAISAVISCAGIASNEATGSPAISSTVYPSGIASTESIGSAAIAAYISASGIASAESIGQPTLSTTAGIVCAGIPSGETFGTPGLSVTISAAGIASGEAIGAPSLAANITATGIASAQAMGAPSIAASIMAASIASAEAIGLPSIGVELFLAGIASAESFGHPSLYTGGGMGEVVAGGAWRKAVEAQTVVGGQWRTIAKVYAVIASEWTELS